MSWCCSCFAKTYEAPEVLELDYRHSSLTEVPPDVFTYERTLEKLDLGCNQICDLPPSLFHCHELRELDLCDNDLMSIPPAIGSLTRLAKLDLSRNAIADIADAVKSCKSLIYLDLSLNHLQKLPEGISQLVNLEELFLNDTYLEFLHANFGRLTKLRVLELRENSLQTLPKSMTRLHHMQRIDIGQNDIFELPEVIGTMTNLVEMWCDNNSIRSIPKFIGNLTKLNCLDASQNDIQEISEEISKCNQLSDLTLASNSLESLPDSFPKLENLTVLRLDSNSIQYLPEDIGNLKNLQELSLIRNLLKSVPASVGLMRKLHTLYLDDNLLAELPKEIGSCSALSILSVGKNRLVTIPSEIGHLSNLKVLTVAGNLLVHLPVSILNIAKLDALWLSESQSKPLLPLNKEIDPNTGQHVLTCYLLPQLPSTQPAENEVGEANDENDVLPPRRSRPSIKFLTDADPQPADNNLSKRGLLRAPTPYPKELRALAKHASNLRSKDQNGDLIINDEPEYEGDYLIGDEHIVDSGKENVRKNSTNGGLFYGAQHQQQQYQPALPVKDYRVEEPGPARNSYHLTNANSRSHSNSVAVAGPQTPLLPLPPDVSNILSSIEQSNKRSEENLHLLPAATNISLLEPYPTLVGDQETGDEQSVNMNGSNSSYSSNKKGPPPYHVAARRAAFFRSTPSSSSSPVGPPSPLTTSMEPAQVPPRHSPVFSHKPISHQHPYQPQQAQQPTTNRGVGGTGDPSMTNYVNVNNRNISNYNPSVNIPGTCSITSGSGDNHSIGISGSISGSGTHSEDNKLPTSVKENHHHHHLPSSSFSCDNRSKFDFSSGAGISWNHNLSHKQGQGLHHVMDLNPINTSTTISEHVISESEIRIMEEVITETINCATGGKRKTFDSTEKTTSVSNKVEQMENKGTEVKKMEYVEDIHRKSSSTVEDLKNGKDEIDLKEKADLVSTIEMSLKNKGEIEDNKDGRGSAGGEGGGGGGGFGQTLSREAVSGINVNRGNVNNWTSSILKNENTTGNSNVASKENVIPRLHQQSSNLQTIHNNFNCSNNNHNNSKKSSSVSSPSGLSSSESFSKIPVLSPTKIPNLNPPSVSSNENQIQTQPQPQISSTKIAEVPHFQQFQPPNSSNSDFTKFPQPPIQQKQLPLNAATAVYGRNNNSNIIDSGSGIGGSSDNNENANNSTSLAVTGSSWSRIPKPPVSIDSSNSHLNNSSNINVNINTNAKTSFEAPISKKPEVGPKPSGIRMTSGSRIPGAYVETKISKPSVITPPSSVPIPNLHASPQSVPTSVSVHQNQPQSQITSPTFGGSRIPRFGESPQQQQQQYQSQHYQKQQQQLPQSQQPAHQQFTQQDANFRGGGSRIPKFNEKPKVSNYPAEPDAEGIDSVPQTTEPPATSPVGSSSGGGSRIPTVAGRKPWIFGTHRNARVVPVEYTKINNLGFTVSDVPLGSNAGDVSGIYVDLIEASDSTVKIGDKILQVDGIDVSNMNIEIVRKILSNCQETIHLLVSRHY